MAGNDYSRHLPAYNEFCNTSKSASGGVTGVIDAVLLSIQKSYEVKICRARAPNNVALD